MCTGLGSSKMNNGAPRALATAARPAFGYVAVPRLQSAVSLGNNRNSIGLLSAKTSCPALVSVVATR